MSVYDDIRAALETRLATTPSIPTIFYENGYHKPVTGTPHIVPRFIPTSRYPAVRGLSPQHRYQGVFQLMLKFPERQGPGPSQELVNTLITRFDSTTDLSFTNSDPQTIYVTIDYSEQMGAYNETPWYITPLNIHWYCYNN
jgi:hypothetical protein